MARVQLALNVTDLDEAIAFYTSVFGTSPAKVEPGYANFAIADPPLKLVLVELPTAGEAGAGGALNHLGVEVAQRDEIRAQGERLAHEGLTTRAESNVTCCFAVQDKVWVTDPDGTPWEFYVVLADAPTDSQRQGETCCTPAVDAACC
jgi:catechol 2,3-dioxygenase-like lactoylglutathione lyase family enzyme